MGSEPREKATFIVPDTIYPMNPKYGLEDG